MSANIVDQSATFQSRVHAWMLECFTPAIVVDKVERNHRYLEESLELVQSLGCTREEAHMLVEYVFGRPAGEPPQETGGAMVTLAALGNANGIDIEEAADTELTRCWTKIPQIRAKQAGKPKGSPLPQATQPPGGADRLREMDRIIASGGNIYDDRMLDLRKLVDGAHSGPTKSGDA